MPAPRRSTSDRKRGPPERPRAEYDDLFVQMSSSNITGAGIGYCNYRGCTGTNNSNGAFFMNSSVSDQNIKDGSSSTILFGETQFGFWGDAASCCARVPLSRRQSSAD